MFVKLNKKEMVHGITFEFDFTVREFLSVADASGKFTAMRPKAKGETTPVAIPTKIRLVKADGACSHIVDSKGVLAYYTDKDSKVAGTAFCGAKATDAELVQVIATIRDDLALLNKAVVADAKAKAELAAEIEADAIV